MNTQPNTTACCCTELGTTKRAQSYRPAVDVLETCTDYRVIADMPGTASEAITISLQDNTLTIDAAVVDRMAGRGRVRRHEYGVGDFHRSFRVGGGIDSDAIEATYEDGVLEVVLPKAAQAMPTRIEVRTA